MFDWWLSVVYRLQPLTIASMGKPITPGVPRSVVMNLLRTTAFTGTSGLANSFGAGCVRCVVLSSLKPLEPWAILDIQKADSAELSQPHFLQF